MTAFNYVRTVEYELTVRFPATWYQRWMWKLLGLEVVEKGANGKPNITITSTDYVLRPKND